LYFNILTQTATHEKSEMLLHYKYIPNS
jgi:hypothetical protein